jgi:hypothetical protein
LRPFIFIRTNLHGGPAMRRAALCSLGGVLIMGIGGLVASVMFVIAVFRILFSGFSTGGRALLIAFAVGLVSQVLGTALLRLGAFVMRGAMREPPEPGAGAQGRRGVTIEGEVVERKESEPPQLGGDQ